MKTLVLFLIRLYQSTVSPDHGWFKARHPYGFCKFYPSCSEYAGTAIIEQGLLFGSVLALLRLLRCVPWAKPKLDPVPKIK